MKYYFIQLVHILNFFQISKYTQMLKHQKEMQFLKADFPSDNILSGIILNVHFPNRQLPKG